MTKRLGLTVSLALVASLLVPGIASAQGVGEALEAKSLELDMVWVAVSCALVFLMQLGFMFLEIGFSYRRTSVRESARSSSTSRCARSRGGWSVTGSPGSATT